MLASRVARASAKGRSWQSGEPSHRPGEPEVAAEPLTGTRFEAASFGFIALRFIGQMRARVIWREKAAALAKKSDERRRTKETMGTRNQGLTAGKGRLQRFSFTADVALL